MPTIFKDLWSDIDFDFETETPVGLLKSQVNVLSQKTYGLLKGELSTYTENNVIYNTFYIVAPRLDYYRFALMRIISGSALYPVYIYDYSKPENGDNDDGLEVKLAGANGAEIPRASIVVSDYARFEEIVKEILSSKETVDIIRSLVSQSKVLMAPSPVIQSFESITSPMAAFNH